jgi:hypothetical protein
VSLEWSERCLKISLKYIRSGSFLFENKDLSLIGYVDAGYLNDPHNGKSQIGFVFLHGGTTISWKSCKHTLISTSSYLSKIIALYEAARECA